MEDKLQEIEKYQQKINDLKREMESERREALLQLHEQVGYDSRRELIEALQRLPGGGGRGRRAVITPAMRQQITEALKQKEPGTAIARRFGVSVATVQNIKKDAGLVRSRS